MGLIGLLVVLLILGLLLGGYGNGAGWGYYGWSPFIVLLVLFLLLWAVGVVHAEELPGAGVAGVIVLGVIHTPRNVYGDNNTGPPGLPYAISYWIGVAITVLLAITGYYTTEWSLGHGADLGITPQQFSLIASLAVGLGVLGRFFPNVQHTVGFRRRELFNARAGIFPRDLARLMPGGEPPT